MNCIKKSSKIVIIFFVFCLFCAISLLACSKNQDTQTSKLNFNTNIEDVEFAYKDVFTVGTSPGFAPFEYFEDDKLKGFDIELAQMIADSLGNRLEFMHYNYNGLLINIADNTPDVDCAISAIVVTPERKQQYNFTEPYLTSDLNMLLICKNDSKITESNFKEAVNVQKVKVGAWSVSSFSKYIKDEYPNVNLFPIDQPEEVINLLDTGQIDLFVADDDFLSKDNNRQKYKVVKDIPVTENIAIAVSKNKPNMLNILNEIIKAKKSDNTIDSLYKKYAGN